MDTEVKYIPLTSETRVEDFPIPDEITLGGKVVPLPRSVKKKDPHFLINQDGNPQRAAWISHTLAYILNSQRFEDSSIAIKQLSKAYDAIQQEISSLIKFGVLRDRRGPGAMAFIQANENVPKNAIVISKRTYDTLCLHNEFWRNTSTVMAVRFPNLGPGTTQELKLVVNKEQDLDLLFKGLPASSIGARINNLKDLVEAVEKDAIEDVLDTEGIIDAFYIHPETLKEGFEGDGRQTCR